MTKALGGALPPSNNLISDFERAADSVKIQIFGYLPKFENQALSLVSKKIRLVADGDLNWKQLFARDFPRKDIQANIPVKEQYLDALNERIHTNILNGRYVSRGFQAHDQRIKVLKIYQRHLFSGSEDKSVKVWGIENGLKVEQVLPVPEGISCLGFHDGRLFVGCSKSKVKVWKEKDGGYVEEVSFSSPNSSINCLGLDNGNVYVGDEASNVIEWERTNAGFEIRQTLLPHQGPLLCLGFHKGLLFIGSEEKNVKILQKKEKGFKVVQSLRHEDWVLDLKFYDGRLFTVCGDKSIKIWSNTAPASADANQSEKGFKKALGGFFKSSLKKVVDLFGNRELFFKVQALEGHDGFIRGIEFHKGLLLSVSEHGTIKIWAEKDNVYTLEETIRTARTVLCSCFHDGVLYLGNDRGIVESLDFSASADEIFQQIAEELEKFSADLPKVEKIKERLLTMPKEDLLRIFKNVFKSWADKKEHPDLENMEKSFNEGEMVTFPSNDIVEAIRHFLKEHKAKVPLTSPTQCDSLQQSFSCSTSAKSPQNGEQDGKKTN